MINTNNELIKICDPKKLRREQANQIDVRLIRTLDKQNATNQEQIKC